MSNKVKKTRDGFDSYRGTWPFYNQAFTKSNKSIPGGSMKAESQQAIITKSSSFKMNTSSFKEQGY